MGTSNWQNIPYCVEILRKYDPKKILDIGVGFGRWGIIAHEFLDVWKERNVPKDWKIIVDGIEIHQESISKYHYYFYDNIFFGDAYDVIKNLKNYDLIILGDVLEHFEPQKAMKLLSNCIRKGKVTMLNVPLGDNWVQNERYGNVNERHLSIYEDKDLITKSLIERKIFRDFQERPFGVYIFGRSIGESIKVLPKKYKKITKNEDNATQIFRYFLRHPHRAKIFYGIIQLAQKISHYAFCETFYSKRTKL